MGSSIKIDGSLDTWIRELPRFGEGKHVHDEWEGVTHEYLITSRIHTHFITGQLRATSYSLVESHGARQEGQIWWPAKNDDGSHYAIWEFRRSGVRADDENAKENLHRDVKRNAINTLHNTPQVTLMRMYWAFVRALVDGLEEQAASWK